MLLHVLYRLRPWYFIMLCRCIVICNVALHLRRVTSRLGLVQLSDKDLLEASDFMKVARCYLWNILIVAQFRDHSGYDICQNWVILHCLVHLFKLKFDLLPIMVVLVEWLEQWLQLRPGWILLLVIYREEELLLVLVFDLIGGWISCFEKNRWDFWLVVAASVGDRILEKGWESRV